MHVKAFEELYYNHIGNVQSNFNNNKVLQGKTKSPRDSSVKLDVFNQLKSLYQITAGSAGVQS